MTLKMDIIFTKIRKLDGIKKKKNHLIRNLNGTRKIKNNKRNLVRKTYVPLFSNH